jgi:hypothetical protein
LLRKGSPDVYARSIRAQKLRLNIGEVLDPVARANQLDAADI